MEPTDELAPGTYPLLSVRPIEAPNRFWAIPILGITIKAIILIPVFVWFGILGLVVIVMTLLNSFSVLLSGQYWPPAYVLSVGLMRLQTRISFYLAGLTDRYPGFGLDIAPEDFFSLTIEMPTSPRRGFAIPVLGGIARGILLIPFWIWQTVLEQAGLLAAVVAFAPVLFAGQYPAPLRELVRDANRVTLSLYCYTLGLSDAYPSFAISMNHRGVKWTFIILGCLLALAQCVGRGSQT